MIIHVKTTREDKLLSNQIRAYGIRKFARQINVDHARLSRIVNNKLTISESTYNVLKNHMEGIRDGTSNSSKQDD